MALSFNKVTKIITVLSPATGVTIQDLLNSIREFEDDLTSLDMPKIVSCAGKEPLGGGVYVGLTLTLLDDWQLAFEARPGPTYVQCRVDGGNLVATNVNGSIYPTAFTQVVVTASSSATQTELELIKHQTFNNEVSLDPANGVSGTEFPIGNTENPVDNLPDALTIAANNNLDIIDLSGTLPISGGDAIGGFTIKAARSLGNVVTVTDAVTGTTYFTDLTISGTMSGAVRYTTCVLGALPDYDGGAKNSLITGDINVVGNGANYFTECDVYVTSDTTYKEISVNDKLVNFIRCEGRYKIVNKTGSNTIVVNMAGGSVWIDSTCTAGKIIVEGVTELIDDSAAGCEVLDDGLVNKSQIANAVLDEVA